MSRYRQTVGLDDYHMFGRMVKPTKDDPETEPYQNYCLKVRSIVDDYNEEEYDGKALYYVEVWDDRTDYDVLGMNFRHAQKALAFYNKCKKLNTFSKIKKLHERLDKKRAELKEKHIYNPYAGLEVLGKRKSK